MAKQKIQFRLGSVPIVEKIFFVQNLALMIRTGFSIGDALAVLQKQTKNKMFQKIIEEIHNDVVEGKNFATALQKHPHVFDELFVSMVNVGEASGNLEGSLQQIVVQTKKSYALKKKIKNAMMYPVLIFFLMIIMGVAIFLFVMPKLLDLYSGGGFDLPLPTKIIVIASTFVRENVLVMSIVLTSITTVIGLIWRTGPGKYTFHKMYLKTPVLGSVIKKINIARMTRVLHSLITTDIPIVHSFQIISRTVGNHVYRKHLMESSEALTKGDSIYSTIAARPDLFEPVIAQMMKVGEDTGTIEEITSEIATFYEEEVDSTMSNLTVIIEPLMMLAMGLGVGFLAVAVIMPIYGLVNEI